MNSEKQQKTVLQSSQNNQTFPVPGPGAGLPSVSESGKGSHDPPRLRLSPDRGRGWSSLLPVCARPGHQHAHSSTARPLGGVSPLVCAQNHSRNAASEAKHEQDGRRGAEEAAPLPPTPGRREKPFPPWGRRHPPRHPLLSWFCHRARMLGHVNQNFQRGEKSCR